MSQHDAYKYSITIKTDDLAVLNCLRALAQFSQKTGNNRIPWGNTKDTDWQHGEHAVTFHFTEPSFRDGFASEVRRLLQATLWEELGRSDTDRAHPAHD